MDTESLVENQIDDGHYLLERLAASGFDVSAAAWIKTADDEEWNLYVVSKTVEEKGLAPAYRASSAVLNQIHDPWASRLELKLVRPDTPLGRRLLEIQRRSGGRASVRMQLLRLGDVAALEVYLYPQVSSSTPGQQPLTPQEVVQKVAGMMSRTGIVRPSQITLKDGTTFLGIPISLEVENGKKQVKFTVNNQGPPRVYPVEEIRSIE